MGVVKNMRQVSPKRVNFIVANGIGLGSTGHPRQEEEYRKGVGNWPAFSY